MAHTVVALLGGEHLCQSLLIGDDISAAWSTPTIKLFPGCPAQIIPLELLFESQCPAMADQVIPCSFVLKRFVESDDSVAPSTLRISKNIPISPFGLPRKNDAVIFLRYDQSIDVFEATKLRLERAVGKGQALYVQNGIM